MNANRGARFFRDTTTAQGTTPYKQSTRDTPKFFKTLLETDNVDEEQKMITKLKKKSFNREGKCNWRMWQNILKTIQEKLRKNDKRPISKALSDFAKLYVQQEKEFFSDKEDALSDLNWRYICDSWIKLLQIMLASGANAHAPISFKPIRTKSEADDPFLTYDEPFKILKLYQKAVGMIVEAGANRKEVEKQSALFKTLLDTAVEMHPVPESEYPAHIEEFIKDKKAKKHSIGRLVLMGAFQFKNEFVQEWIETNENEWVDGEALIQSARFGFSPFWGKDTWKYWKPLIDEAKRQGLWILMPLPLFHLEQYFYQHVNVHSWDKAVDYFKNLAASDARFTPDGVCDVLAEPGWERDLYREISVGNYTCKDICSVHTLIQPEHWGINDKEVFKAFMTKIQSSFFAKEPFIRN